MPVDRIFSASDAVWGLWRIEEQEASLAAEVPHDAVSDSLTNPLKRLEFLAGRALIKALLARWTVPYHGLRKNAFGKPFLIGSDVHISLSHSYPYVAAILHRCKNVGIDLEQPKTKLLRIAPRILAAIELKDAGEDVVKHCVYWCAKETLIKIHGKKDLIFSENLLIEPFRMADGGLLIGRIVADNTQTAIPLQYIVSGNFVLVVSG
jgi:4'-phosphopantetheinyl transferase